MHYAVKYNQSKITTILLKNGADPNLFDCENMTPTLMACEIGNDLTVNELIQNVFFFFFTINFNNKILRKVILANKINKVIQVLF